MIVKQLNGTLWSFEQPPSIQELANTFNVFPENVCLTPYENDPDMFLLLIVPHPYVKIECPKNTDLSTLSLWSWIKLPNLHENILKWLFTHSSCIELARHPHPVCVSHFVSELGTHTSQKEILLHHLCFNSSDTILKFLKSIFVPETFRQFVDPSETFYQCLQGLCNNSNCLAIPLIDYLLTDEHFQEFRNGHSGIFFAALLRHPTNEHVRCFFRHASKDVLLSFDALHCLRIGLNYLYDLGDLGDLEDFEIFDIVDQYMSEFPMFFKMSIYASSQRERWLSEYIKVLDSNDKIYTRTSGFENFLQNPHRLAIEWIVNKIDRLDPMLFVKPFFTALCKNPSDKIVDFLLSNPQYIDHRCMIDNDNLRAKQYLSQWYRKEAHRLSLADLIKACSVACELTEFLLTDSLISTKFTFCQKLVMACAWPEMNVEIC